MEKAKKRTGTRLAFKKSRLVPLKRDNLELTRLLDEDGDITKDKEFANWGKSKVIVSKYLITRSLALTCVFETRSTFSSSTIKKARINRDVEWFRDLEKSETDPSPISMAKKQRDKIVDFVPSSSSNEEFLLEFIRRANFRRLDLGNFYATPRLLLQEKEKAFIAQSRLFKSWPFSKQTSGNFPSFSPTRPGLEKEANGAFKLGDLEILSQPFFNSGEE